MKPKNIVLPTIATIGVGAILFTLLRKNKDQSGNSDLDLSEDQTLPVFYDSKETDLYYGLVGQPESPYNLFI